MPLVMYEYIEVNLVGTALLLAMLLFTRRSSPVRQGEEQTFFVRMVVLNILILLADNGIYLLRGHSAPELIFCNHLVCLTYFILHPWFCYNWVFYVLARLQLGRQLTAPKRWALRVPALICTLLAAASPATGWIYSLSATNTYQRGPLLSLLFAGALLYWSTSAAVIVWERRHPTRSREAGEYWALLLFPVPSLLGNLLQLHFYGLSIVWVCSALSMLILFLDMQDDQLSRDAMTGLFNRRQTNLQLLWEMEHLRTSGELLFVAMLDVDHFKQINDRWGHLAGDHALTVVADVLRENCRKSDFASRFGGDEFLLVGHVQREEDAAQIAQRVESAVAAAEKRAHLPYHLSVSVGYTVCGRNDGMTMDYLLDRADERMYDVKRAKEACR